MSTELEKMLTGEYADITDPELHAMALHARGAIARLNALNISSLSSPEYREALLDLIPGTPDSATVLPPFFCDYGSHITLGENVFVNFNCCFLDGGTITIGDHTLIGPAVQIYTPQHPMDHVERRKPIEKALPVVIGSDCWIGGGAVICPGVTIGDRCIIGAGSVVTKDIPEGSLAVGNPARVIRKLDNQSK